MNRGLRVVSGAALVLGSVVCVVSPASAQNLPPGALGSDGVAPTYGRASNGSVAEVWPAGGQILIRARAGSTWSGQSLLASLPGGLSVASSVVAVGTNNLGNLEVYIVASDRQVWHSYAGAGASNWSPLTPLGGPSAGIAGNVAVGTNYVGNQELYVTSPDGQVFHRFATPGQGGGWSGWDTMGRPAPGVRGGVSVGKNSEGNQELYIVGNDGQPYHNFATPGVGSGWNGWDPLGGPVPPLGDVSAAINYVGNQELYFVGSDRNIWHNFATPGRGSGWAGWSVLGAPFGGPTGDVAVQPRDFNVLGQQWIRVTVANGSVWQDTQTPGVGTGWSGWAAPTPSLANVIPDGTYIVGSQIAPGAYRVGQYWETENSAQQINANDFTLGCPSIMVIEPTDVFVKIEGQAIALTNSPPFDPMSNQCSSGSFVVGKDIQPGTYRVNIVPGGDATYWARMDAHLEIIDNDFAFAPTIVVIQPGDFAVQITGTISPA